MDLMKISNSNDSLLSKPLPLVLSADSHSKSGFSYIELRNYSFVLAFIVFIGLLCYFFVLFILVYQQIKLYSFNKILNNQKESENCQTNINYFKENSKNEDMLDKNNNEIFTLENNHSADFESVKMVKPKLIKDYRNYVTYAFVFHQTIVDLLRIFYSLLYSNRIYYEYKLNYENSNSDVSMKNDFNSALNIFYENYCTQMASFYSVLTMVTIVNILTILISETCRYYDLKFNSNDTSNYCCVIFGIMLIWISSLIIISSLMLVGVVESAVPTWNCDMGESESSTRSLVINITWFLLVAFILIIAFSYSISLYRELSSLLDIGTSTESFFSGLPSQSHNSLQDEISERQNKIVKETIKRLFILSLLIVVFCATFLPNFITTLMKNILQANQILLNPYNLISCIINLSNSSLNSIVLLALCIKSNDKCLTNNLFSNEIEHYRFINKRKNSQNIRLIILNIIQRFFYQRSSCLNDKINNLDDSNLNNKIDNNFSGSNSNLNCDKDCIQLKTVKNYSNYTSEHIESNDQKQNNNSINIINSISTRSKNLNNVNEFYSKIGNRLGNL